MNIRITKEFRFEAAHMLSNYDGLCRNVHGHSYRMFVTVRGAINHNVNDPKNGMVMDFGVLKGIVNRQVVDRLDHSLMIYRNSPEASKVTDLCERIYLTPYQPTCENMVCDFAERIQKELPKDIELVAIKLYETQTSYAEWLLEDNAEPLKD